LLVIVESAKDKKWNNGFTKIISSFAYSRTSFDGEAPWRFSL